MQVVITSQMATKLLNPDGSNGTFDTSSKAVMVPQLGTTDDSDNHYHEPTDTTNQRFGIPAIGKNVSRTDRS
jgi:hypothetical protein